MPDADTNMPRMKLLFCIEGLPLREELVIKSLVRLLSHRTHQYWIYSPEKVDLKIVGHAVDDMAEQCDPATTASQVLRVGQVKRGNGPFLSLPVHSNELELMLNDLGKRISQSRRAELEANPRTESNVEFRLLRWPPATLLAAQGRMKVATLIMGRSMTATMLVQRSGVAMDECEFYLRELHEKGFLAMHAGGSGTAQGSPAGVAGAPAEVKEKVPSGLLSRIRSRLGLAA